MSWPSTSTTRRLRSFRWVRRHITTAEWREMGDRAFARFSNPDPNERDRLWQAVVLTMAPLLAKYQKKSGRFIPLAMLSTDPVAR
jgi:hypothetical protein